MTKQPFWIVSKQKVCVSKSHIPFCLSELYMCVVAYKTLALGFVKTLNVGYLAVFLVLGKSDQARRLEDLLTLRMISPLRLRSWMCECLYYLSICECVCAINLSKEVCVFWIQMCADVLPYLFSYLWVYVSEALQQCMWVCVLLCGLVWLSSVSPFTLPRRLSL